MDRRDRYPESSFWETEPGRAWLIRLMVATLFEFGLKRGVGAETLSEFFGYPRKAGHSVTSGLQAPEAETARDGPPGHSE